MVFFGDMSLCCRLKKSRMRWKPEIELELPVIERGKNQRYDGNGIPCVCV